MVSSMLNLRRSVPAMVTPSIDFAASFVFTFECVLFPRAVSMQPNAV